MSDSFKVKNRINIAGTTVANTSAGDLRVDSSDANKLKYHDGSSEDSVVLEAALDAVNTAKADTNLGNLANTVINTDLLIEPDAEVDLGNFDAYFDQCFFDTTHTFWISDWDDSVRIDLDSEDTQISAVDGGNVILGDSDPDRGIAFEDVTAGTIGHIVKSVDVNGKMAWGTLVNANVDPAAAIAYSKLNLSGSIVNADVNASAAIDASKIAD